jgi:hypothetical protein
MYIIACIITYNIDNNSKLSVVLIHLGNSFKQEEVNMNV